ncbi:DUF805 domain-containing protein [Lelliottia sp. WAP21]|uniref:DUF805 domain-containing protein n=1 Tax=Lelliottia sp. WAP21 TaxID=2877426 RepID=UPI001E63C3CF|nr:DUF805 domain-containing protein [Lelliottia sp. WAP21]
MDWYLKVLNNYFGFNGRARRKEYWMFFLINTLISLALSGAVVMLDVWILGFIPFLYYFATFIPTWAVTFRRLHDTERSAWWLLLIVIPVIGPLVLLCFLCEQGTVGDNRFGANPKLNT